MKRKRGNLISRMIEYAILLFLSHAILFLLCDLFIKHVLGLLWGICPYWLLVILGCVCNAVFYLALPILVITLYLKTVIPSLYTTSGGRLRWLGDCAAMILPAEGLRYLACAYSLGITNHTGIFSPLPTLLFERIYLYLSNRRDEVRYKGNFIPADHAAYAACYLWYAAVYLFVLALICRHLWLQAEKDRRDLVIYE